MRVGIVSDAHHYLDLHGRPAPLTGVARQFEQWALLFDEVVVCAPLLPGLPPAMHSAYAASNIRLLPTCRAGGGSIAAKVGLAMALPGWGQALRRLLGSVDAIHIRCPNNISILGLLMLRAFPGQRHAAYTGNWHGYQNEPWTYGLQRFALKHWFSGPVSVYGSWPGQPEHIVESFSPPISDATWLAEAHNIPDRLRRISSAAWTAAVHLLTVGTLDRNKNQAVAIRALAALLARGHHVELRVAGGGPNLAELRGLASTLNAGHAVQFLGQIDSETLRAHYRWADFIVQPSLTEGFSKVTVEAMTHGVVPLLSDLPVNRDIVAEGSRGATFAANSESELVNEVLRFMKNPTLTVSAVQRCRDYAKGRTLEAWRRHLHNVLMKHWGEA